MDAPYKLKRPAGLEKFILQQADKTYLIFDRKEDTVLCTRCGAKHKLSEMNDYEYLEHNRKHWCYDCRTEAVCKERRYGRRGLTEFGRILWTAKHGAATYAQLDEYQIIYTGDAPEVKYWVSAQYKFTAKEQAYHNHVQCGWWGDEHWETQKNVKLPEPYAGMWNSYKVPKYFKTIMYPEIKLGTDLRYALLKTENPYTMIGYLAAFLKYPSIEMLQSAGLYGLIEEKARGRGCREINWRGKDLRKVLKLNFEEIRQLKQESETFSLLVTYKNLHRDGLAVTFEEAAFMDNYTNHGAMERLKESGVDILKAIRYIVRQNGEYDRYSSLKDYEDYLEFCRKLQLDISRRKILRPCNFAAEHDRLEKIVAQMQEKVDRESFANTQRKLTGMTAPFIAGGLLIRPAASPEELTVESTALGHCVRTYKDKVCRGITSILFIRSTSEPGRPFYTLELDKAGKIVQCRGKSNRSMTPEVKTFVDKWYAEWKKEHKEAA